jgi:NADH-quinone oxidoreductase subunit G
MRQPSTGALGVLASPHSTLEELALASKLARGLGSTAIDHRLRQSDFSDDRARAGIPWLGMPVADVGSLDRVLVIGSFLRKDHPLVAQRLRQAAKRGAQVTTLHAVDDDWLMPLAHRAIVAPSLMPSTLAGIVVAVVDSGAGAVSVVALEAGVAEDTVGDAVDAVVTSVVVAVFVSLEHATPISEAASAPASQRHVFFDSTIAVPQHVCRPGVHSVTSRITMICRI